MSYPVRRMTATIAKFGDDFTVGATPGVGLFSILGATAAQKFLSDADIMSVGKPIYQAIVSADDATEATDTVTWGGLSLTVLLVLPYWYHGETLAKRLVLA